MNQWVQGGVVGPPWGLKGSFFISTELPLFFWEQVLWDKGVRLGRTPLVGFGFQAEFCKKNDRFLLKVQDKDKLIKKGLSLWVFAPFWPCHSSLGQQVWDSCGELMGQLVSIENFGAAPIGRIEQGEKSWEIPMVEAYFLKNERGLQLNRPLGDWNDFAEL